MSSKCLAELSVHTIGGGWGLEEQDSDHTQKVAVIRGTDIPRVASGDYSTVPLRWEKPSKTRSRLLHPGDIIVEVSGGSSAKGQHTGRALLVNQRIIDRLGGSVIPASFCRLLRLDSGQVNSDFITYQIASMHISGEIADFENQSTGISNFQFTKFLESVKPEVSNIGAQREIVSVLHSLDNRIDNLRATNTTLEAIAQALFKSWFIDFDPVRAKMEGREPEGMDAETAALFPSEFEESELGLIPRGWRVQPIGELTEIVGGSTPDTKNEDYWAPGVFHWTSPKDLSGATAPVLIDTERLVSEAGLTKISSGLLPPETLLLSSRAPIGYLSLSKIPVAINQGYIAMLPGGTLPTVYLYFWTQANMEVIKDRSNGSTFMEISKKMFRPIPALVPPLAVAGRFAGVAEGFFDRITANQRQAHHLSDLRDLLLPRLISGKISLGAAGAALEAA